MKILDRPIRLIRELIILPLLIIMALLSRIFAKTRKFDVGLGPLPLINNVYHKDSIQRAGFSAETFVNKVYFITDNFDIRVDKFFIIKNKIMRSIFGDIVTLYWIFFRYKLLVIYFDGLVYGRGSIFLWRMEPTFLKIAGIKSIVLPYGSDVQAMSRSNNLPFKNALAIDYPNHKRRHSRITKMIDLWTTQGDHVISGCDWVDYMHHWDTLLLAHFSIRIPTYTPAPVREERDNRLIKILHAPNHRTIKGTYFIVKAIQALKDEGFPFELVLAERVPNSEVQRLIKESDIIIDQLIVGWYAMFAIEAMAQGKPVICYLRNDLIELFKANSLIETSEDIPIINTTINSLKTVLIEIYLNPKTLNERGVASYDFVKKFHSIEAISSVFKPILNKLMIN